MYPVSENFLKQIKADNREFSIRLTFNSSTTELTGATVQNITVEEIVNSADVLTLGCACSNKVTVNLINAPTDIDYENSFFDAKVELKMQEMPTVYERVLLGRFYITEATTNNDFRNLTITAYDGFSKMAGNYIPSIIDGETTTLQAFYDDIKTQLSNQFGIILMPKVCPDYDMTIPNIENLSYQQAIGYLAGCLGGFARFNRLGNLEIVSYTDSGIIIDRSTQYMNGFKRTTEKPLTITSLSTGTKDNVIVRGEGANGTVINFENPFITDSMADSIFAEFNNFTYTPCQVKWRGNPAIQAGDIVTVLDKDEVPHKVLVMSQNIKISGGLNATIDCKGKSITTSNFSNSFETSAQKLDRVYKSLEQAIINATNAITGNSGGYVVLYDKPDEHNNTDGKPDEILIMDTDSVETATKVWCWNKAGLGYSEGLPGIAYLGPYRTAITADGQISADFITTGTLSAERIAVESYDGKGQLTDYIHFGEGYMTFGETGNQLTLKLDNDEIVFLKKETNSSGVVEEKQVARFSNNTFEIDHLGEGGQIRFQNFGFIPRTSGNLSFTKLK